MAGATYEKIDPIATVQEVGGYVTVGRAAVLLGVSKNRVQWLIHHERITALPVSDVPQTLKPMWLVEKQSITDFLESLSPTGKKRGPQKGNGGRPVKIQNVEHT